MLVLLSPVLLLLMQPMTTTAQVQSTIWTHSAVLDVPENYHLFWKIEKNDQITFEVQVKTLGYVGFGLSPHGAMLGADLVIGWVKDGQTYLYDLHAKPGYEVTLDATKDYQLLSGYENETHTVLRFRRPFHTCDEVGDMDVSEDTLRIIWSYHPVDPQSTTTNIFHYHGATRGVHSVFVFEPQMLEIPKGNDIQTWDILNPNVSVPAEASTLYWCKLHQVPEMSKKHHMIGFVPIIQPGNEANVHHMIMYECVPPPGGVPPDLVFGKYKTHYGAPCYNELMPPEFFLCQHATFAWAIGSEGDVFPEHVGLPFGKENNGITYYMLETHYDNPTHRGDIVDSSGFRIFHTDTLRRYDAGSIWFGANVVPTQFIPPGQRQYVTMGNCPGDCTGNNIPEGGIKLISGVLHGHLTAKIIRLRHIRNGIELPPILVDRNYDFNYQQTRILKEEVTILPGDELITECVGHTEDRKMATTGGLSTYEEMCLVFGTYYPRIKINSCLSMPTFETFLSALGIQSLYGQKSLLAKAKSVEIVSRSKDKGEGSDKARNKSTPSAAVFHQLLKKLMGMKIMLPLELRNMTVIQRLMSLPVNDKEFVANIQREMGFGQHYSHCSERALLIRGGLQRVGYPEFKEYVPPKPQC